MARIAVVLADLFEDSEFRVPYDTLRNAGHQVEIIGLEAGREIRGKKGKESVRAERAIQDVNPDDFDALVIPGGYSPDILRMNPHMVRFVKQMVDSGKPVGAVCHAPWMLAEADVIRGRTVTSWASIKTDLVNAGAKWIDRQVVEDGNLITSRKPDDLPEFTQAILRKLESSTRRTAAHTGVLGSQP